MRPLTESELRTFFEKLKKYIGKNIRQLIEPQTVIDDDDEEDNKNMINKIEPCCFRLHKDRVYYLSESLLKLSTKDTCNAS